ncbi:MAG: DNA damage-inducible protein DinB [Bacteroidetes bacterium B1(2017)]|nr:MAG: DNA damage-inducible protein DinB [Bacteroidetes bacterium B1(2017)]
MQVQLIDTIDLVTSLDDETLKSAYAPGKWSILEILVHLMDCERIFAYRALRFARKDKTELAGFEEDLYAPASKANDRKILGIVKEFSLLRASTIELFQSFDEEMWAQTGTANGKTTKVSAIPYILCGHEIHHRNIIEERYIGK